MLGSNGEEAVACATFALASAPISAVQRYIAESSRVARELVVVDTAAHPGARPDGWQERRLRDGSCHTIYKRHFTPVQLRAELGGGEVLFEGRFFVSVRVALSSQGSRP